MSRYTEGVCDDGAAILKDGVPVSITEILSMLNLHEQMVNTQIGMQRAIDTLRDEHARPLLAAAPELYEALRYMVTIFEHHAETPEEFNAIGTALNVLGTAEGDEGDAA
ncbi:hypothetical protein [Rhizobium leguminosarum]